MKTSTNQSIKLLHQFAGELAKQNTLEDIFWLISQNVMGSLGFEDCVIYLLSENGKLLEQKAAFGPKNPSGKLIKNPIEIPIGAGIVGATAELGEVHRIGDTSKDPRYIVDDDIRLSELAAPIFYEGKCIGVIDTEHHQRHFYTEDDEFMLLTISRMAAVQIGNARKTSALTSTIKKLEDSESELIFQSAALKQAKLEADKASAAKSEFLSLMSHEIKSPLNSIIAMAFMLDEMELDEDATKASSIIKKSGDHLLSLITSILDFSTYEANANTVQQSRIDLRALVNEVQEICCGKLDKEKVSYTFTISEDLPEFVQSDEIKLKQILLNLLGNAIKFTHDGAISLHVSKGRVNKTDIVSFRIKDSGIGIATDKFKHLFDAFYLGDSSHTRQYGGTGLGLNIALRYAELLGGTITVKSSLGSGSEFDASCKLIPA